MDVPEMSLAEKVGQVLICHVHGDKAGDDARQLIQGLGIVEVIYYNWANGDLKKKKWAALSSELQTLAKIPFSIPRWPTTQRQPGARAAARRLVNMITSCVNRSIR